MSEIFEDISFEQALRYSIDGMIICRPDRKAKELFDRFSEDGTQENFDISCLSIYIVPPLYLESDGKFNYRNVVPGSYDQDQVYYPSHSDINANDWMAYWETFNK